MKIGIMTLHWAPNFGAVLQAYALQDYLRRSGHEAFIIDYKPYVRDFTPVNFVLNRKVLHPAAYLREAARDSRLEKFRRLALVRSRRYGSLKELRSCPPEADLYMTGSDQTMHPRMLLRGERGPTTAYMLDFGSADIARCGYAVSFGCTSYPPEAAALASSRISLFGSLSVREDSALELVRAAGYGGRCEVVPDPVVLAGRESFDRFIPDESPYGSGYTYKYMLRSGCPQADVAASSFGRVVSAGPDTDIVSWLAGIRYASRLVTNSYHGVVFALLYHVPFVAVLETGAESGMNGRFVTLLSRCSLEGRLSTGQDSEEIRNLFAADIDWDNTDACLGRFRQQGMDFISAAVARRPCRENA